jgi:uroporphyrinogen decarboxylase
MMAPKQFEDLLQPCYKRLTDVVHSRGKQIILHTDGYITPLLDFIINSGFDGLQSLEPSAGVNLSEVRRKVGNRLCLLGNIDTGEVLTTGTKEQVFSAVKTAIQQGGPKGFMVSAANMHPAVKVQNLQWMIEAAHKFNTFS